MSWWRRSPDGGTHNIHYHPVIFDAIHGHPEQALDIGCGEGALARELRAVVPQVTAIDADPASIDLARQLDRGSRIDYLLGDFLTFPFEPNMFDVIVSVATLHHMDAHGGARTHARSAPPWRDFGSHRARTS